MVGQWWVGVCGEVGVISIDAFQGLNLQRVKQESHRPSHFGCLKENTSGEMKGGPHLESPLLPLSPRKALGGGGGCLHELTPALLHPFSQS